MDRTASDGAGAKRPRPQSTESEEDAPRKRTAIDGGEQSLNALETPSRAYAAPALDRAPAMSDAPAANTTTDPTTIVGGIDDMFADNSDDDMDQPAKTNAASVPKIVGGIDDMFAELSDDDDDQPAKTNAVSVPQVATRNNHQSNWTGQDGRLNLWVGEVVNGTSAEWTTVQAIGKGSYASVYKAKNTKDHTLVAIKVAIKNDFTKNAGRGEADFIRMVHEEPSSESKFFVHLMDEFTYKLHYCLAFEFAEKDLRQLLSKTQTRGGLPLGQIRMYAEQAFRALRHLKKCELLHTDIKPENILLINNDNQIQICDFGTALMHKYVDAMPAHGSRWYRAPEIMLGYSRCDYSLDIWSLGVTLFEMTGSGYLFRGDDNNEMLREQQECRGAIPRRILLNTETGKEGGEHFMGEEKHFSFKDKRAGTITEKKYSNQALPGKSLRERVTGTMSKRPTAMQPKKTELNSLIDLLEKCLLLDAWQRIEVDDALTHPFIIPGNPIKKSTKRSVPRQYY